MSNRTWKHPRLAALGLVALLGIPSAHAGGGGGDKAMKGDKAMHGDKAMKGDKGMHGAKAMHGDKAGRKLDRATIDRLLTAWPAKPKAVAYVTIKKYGLPNEATASELTWHNNGPWKRTTIYRQEVPHHFPKLHTDVMEQVIDYQVPPDKFDELAAFDGSVVASRTVGELSARCDFEEANFLALNLAQDVAEGKRSVKEAREAYGKNVVAFMTGKESPRYMAGLHFEHGRGAADPDEVTLPGAPKPEGEVQRVAGRAELGDGEILGLLVAKNTNEVIASKFILEHVEDAQVRRLAETLRRDHAEGLKSVMGLAGRVDATPVEGDLADQVKAQGAKGLAKLAQLEGRELSSTYLDLTIENHRKSLDQIDRQLLPAAEGEQVKQQLQTARKKMAAHLAQAEKLRRQRQ